MGHPDTTFAAHHADRLVDVAARSAHPDGGFGWQDDEGRIDTAAPRHTLVTCRMTHVLALAEVRGDSRAGALVEHGLAALTGALADPTHGGWHSVEPGEGGPTGDKEAYNHAFVVLAAASAAGAGHGRELLDDALSVMERFWSEDDGMVVDTWSADFTTLDPYRGVNANMHSVEAFLAAADITGDPLWLGRAERITARVIDRIARTDRWRLPEHFDESWNPLRDYNIDEPGHPFRPYGVTIGHQLEWSRLCLHLETALGESAPAWLRPAAIDLYATGVRNGWNVDGAPGFVYTTDFDDRPVVRERMHWVVTEAIAAAWALHRATGDASYLADHERWWEYATSYLIDDDGSWRHELGTDNHPSARVWRGRPDVYHAYQATILPLLPDAGSLIGAALTP